MRFCICANSDRSNKYTQPIPVRSYESELNAVSLKNLLSSAREQKVLKAHKSRCKPTGIKKKIRNLAKWELNLTHAETIKRLKRLHNEHDEIDWAIFDFKEHKKHSKYLVIPDDQYGTGGSEALSKELAKIDQVKLTLTLSIH